MLLLGTFKISNYVFLPMKTMTKLPWIYTKLPFLNKMQQEKGYLKDTDSKLTWFRNVLSLVAQPICITPGVIINVS
jgi:hypothetical protein